MSESVIEQRALDDPGFVKRRDELLVAVAEPLVRDIIDRKLIQFTPRRSVGRLTPSLDDLTHDVLEELTRKLNNSPPDSPLWETEVFIKYAARAAGNRCHDLFRDDLPAREQLRKKIYRALNTHHSFAVWESGGRIICGFASWSGRDPDPEAAARLERGDIPETSPSGAGKTELTVTRVAAVLNRSGGPVEVERLLRVISEMCAIDRGSDISLSEDNALLRRTPAPGRTDDGLAYREHLKAYWSALGDLPWKQRVAVALTQENSVGDCWLEHVLFYRFATWQEVSRSLGLTPERLRVLGGELPASYATVAELLGVSLAESRKLRCVGWKRVRERLFPEDAKDISTGRE